MKNILKRIAEAKHIVVISHINPDADSLASASAMYTYLLTLHKKVSFFCLSKDIHQKLSFLPWFDKIRNSFPSSADLAIALDCSSQSRIGIEIECDLINIDHHSSNENYADFNLVSSTSISTTQVLFDFFKTNKIQINKKMATALYAGIIDDSDGFLSSDVDGTIFALVNELISSGAMHHTCNDFILKYRTLASLRLKALMLSNMSLINNAEIVVFLVKQDDFKATGAAYEDCELALEEALFLPTVKVTLLLRENENLAFKGSLRSKKDFDLSSIALELNGGGHKNRIGFELDTTCTMEKTVKKIVTLINKEI